MTKQKIVISVSMSCEKSRSKAMALVARTDGVSSMGVTGDSKDRLEVICDGVDTVCLVQRMHKKVGYAVILQVEKVKDKKPEEIKKQEEPKVLPQLPYYYHYHPGYCHYYLPPPWL